MLQVEVIVQENVSEEKEQIQKYYPAMPEEAKGSYLVDYEKQLTEHISRKLEDMSEEEKSEMWMDVFMYGEHLSETLVCEYYKDFHITFEQVSEIFNDILQVNGIEERLSKFILEKEKSNLENLYESECMKREKTYGGCQSRIYLFVDKILKEIGHYQEEYVRSK